MKLNLSKLGYTSKWIELDILDEERFKRQFVEFRKGEDSNKEHYRYKTLCNWMDEKIEFDIKTINGVIEILKNDEDKGMATASYFRLYTKETISHEQKKLLEKEWTDTNEQLKKLIENEKLSKKIESGNISIELFEDCFKNGKMLRLIISHTENQSYLEKLMSFATSKKIRNLAKDKYNRVIKNL